MIIGDIVRLKSGGPKMTVQIVYGDLSALRGYVQVAWFDEVKNIHEHSFSIESLVKVEVVR